MSGTEPDGNQRAGWWRNLQTWQQLAGIVGTLTGVVGLFLALGVIKPFGATDTPEPPPEPELNPIAYAALIRQGPFSEELPGELKAGELRDVNIGDPSAAPRIDAVELEIRNQGAVSAFAHLEVYPSARAAKERAGARIDLLERIIGRGAVTGDVSSYCSDGTIGGSTAWECGGTTGLVYVEATLSPNANAFLPLATGTVAALLGYAEEKARVAAGS